MRKIILHVGMHKTGTTSIQNGFFQQRYRLECFDIMYPNLNGTGRNHSIPIYSLYSEKPEKYHINIRSKRTSDESLKKFHDEIISSFQDLIAKKWKTLVLSGEDISVLSENALINFKNDLNLWFPDALIEVVCCVRHPENYWRSVVTELTKNGVSLDGLAPKLGIDRFYERLLNKLISVFGEKSLKLYKFEDSKSYIVDFFFKKYVSDSIDIEFGNVFENASICQEVFLILHELNKKYPLIVNGEISENRALDDVHGLLKLSGGKCVDVGVSVKEKVINDIRYLKDVFSIEWVDSETHKSDLWGLEFIEGLYFAMPRLNEFIRDIVVDVVRKNAIDLIDIDNRKSMDMLLFCHFFRPNGPLIKSKLLYLSDLLDVALSKKDGVYFKV